jgi:DNA-binding transcriptional MerR regulator
LEQELLTLQEIAERLNMPPSTVRYYRNKYKEFMPEVKAGRYMKYEPEAVEIIKFIAAATAATQQQQEIKELLSAKFALNIEKNTDGQESTAATAAATTTQQQQTDIVNKEHYRILAQANQEIYFLRQLVQELQQDNRELTRQLLQIKAPERRPWYKRIFNRER